MRYHEAAHYKVGLIFDLVLGFYKLISTWFTGRTLRSVEFSVRYFWVLDVNDLE